MSFKAVQSGIESKEGVSPKAAGAILASKTRQASPAAKKANPNLKKVLGAPKVAKPAAAKKPPTKNQPAWAGIADQMLGNAVPATGVAPKGGNGTR